MKDATMLSVTAIGGLTILEAVAMCTGNDGAYFLPIVAAISGLGGFTLGTVRQKVKTKKEVPE